jgi:hypothetical protein
LVQEDGVTEDLLVSIKDLQSFDADGRGLGSNQLEEAGHDQDTQQTKLSVSSCS